MLPTCHYTDPEHHPQHNPRNQTHFIYIKKNNKLNFSVNTKDQRMQKSKKNQQEKKSNSTVVILNQFFFFLDWELKMEDTSQKFERWLRELVS